MSKLPSSRLQPIDARRLLELNRISQYGSFTKAAESLRVSQPALSRSISILERGLGVQLLERTRNGVHLTKLGSELVVYAEALEALLTRATEDMKNSKAGLRGSLAIGVSPVACASLIPQFVIRLKNTWPRISISIDQGSDDALIRRLRSGTLDLVVSPISAAPEATDIVREVLLPDSLIVVARAGSPWAGPKPVKLHELRDAHWIMPNPATVMWQNIQALFAAENVAWPENCTICNSILAIKSLIATSDFVTISSSELMKPEIASGAFEAIKLKAASYSRRICVHWRRDAVSSPTISKALDLLRDVAKDLRAPEARPRSSAGRTTLAKRSR